MSINENQQPGHDDREPIKDPVFEAAPEPKVPTVQTSLFKPESADAQAANGSGDDLISDSKALADAQTADGQTRQYERAAAALNYHPGQFPGRVKPVADSAEGESDPTSRSEAGGTGGQQPRRRPHHPGQIRANRPYNPSATRGKRDLQRLHSRNNLKKSSQADQKKTGLIIGISIAVVILALFAAYLYYQSRVGAPRKEAEQAIAKLYGDENKTVLSPQLNEADLAAAEQLVEALPESDFREEARQELSIVRHCLYLMQVRDAYAAEERSYADLSPDQLDQALSKAENVATQLDDLIVQELSALREEYRTWEAVSTEVQLYNNDPLLFYHAEDSVVVKLTTQIESLSRAVDRQKLHDEAALLSQYRTAYRKLQEYNDFDYDLSEVDVTALSTEMKELAAAHSKLYIPLAGVWAKLEVEVENVRAVEQALTDAHTVNGELRKEFSEEDYKRLDQMVSGLLHTKTRSSYQSKLEEIRTTLKARKAAAEAAEKAELERRRDEILNKVFTPREAADLLYWRKYDSYPENSNVDLAYYEPTQNILTGRWDLKIIEDHEDRVVTVEHYSMDLKKGLAYDLLFPSKPPLDLHQLMLKQEGIPDSAPAP